jgi:hypothetical protein
MTLCAAWIRKTTNSEELVVATDSRTNKEELVVVTDSRLGGGESWDTGIKLFDIQRPDCLLCFAGRTARAYPLMLHLRSSIQFNPKLANPQIDIHVVLEHLKALFTELCKDFGKLSSSADIHVLRSEADFLFGGWSWQMQQFCLWKVSYLKDTESFESTAYHDPYDQRMYAFLGDDLDAAERVFREVLDGKNKGTRGAFDMEPLKVLAIMSRDNDNYKSIGGALQVAKVYKSGHNEFFGVMWQSVEGKPHFLGKELHEFNKPPVRFLDPDTGEVLENLPPLLGNLNGFDFGTEQEFVSGCYPNDSLRDEISEGDKAKLSVILKDAAYINFTSEIKNHWLVSNDDTGAHDE